jgi:hypothetical protein
MLRVKSDETKDGKKVYQMPAMNYEQAFGEVCKVIDQHPELWNRPSREAVTFAVNELWKRKDYFRSRLFHRPTVLFDEGGHL